MSGRILPVALATVVGISIGVATFDRELKQQRRQRLQEEYEREVAAQAALTSQGVKPVAANAIPPPAPPLEAKKVEAQPAAQSASSSWSSMLGLWAWKKDGTTEAAPAKQPAPAPADNKSQP